MKRKLISKVLDLMLREAKKRGAEVFSVSELMHDNPYRSLIFSILSARTKDATTIAVCKKLFRKYPTIHKLANADVKEVEKAVYGVGFYRQKARYIVNAARMVVEEFDGKIPSDYDALVRIPGVGRKVANVVLLHVFGKNRIPVDTHVHRISNRLGWVKTEKPEQTEEALMKLVPRSLWRKVNRAMVAYGQTVCLPRNPKCKECKIRSICAYYKY
jgi:endonuclease-3